MCVCIGDSHRVNCSSSCILPTISCKSCSTRYKLTQMFDLDLHGKLLQKTATEKERKRETCRGCEGKIRGESVCVCV